MDSSFLLIQPYEFLTLDKRQQISMTSHPAVLQRGDDFLSEYPRGSRLWQWASHGTCLLTIAASKLVLSLCYNVRLNGFEKLERALDRTVHENRGLMTVMNHMSVVDDPFMWGVFPWRIYKDLDQIRWSLGAHNVCFSNRILSGFFSLGKVLSTERFGAGPFQGSIDAAIRLLSPDDTLDLEWTEMMTKDTNGSAIVNMVKNCNYKPPVKRMRPSWMHVFPEGFVLQLQPPHSNSMRYFKWGITRMILESTRPPIIVPIFATGFEKIAPESAADKLIERYLPRNFGAQVDVTVGDPIDDRIIERYRDEWRNLVKKYSDPKNPSDLSLELREGRAARSLRSRLAAELREHVANIRHKEQNMPQEDDRFKSPHWWKRYTETEGASASDVQFIGQNWAIRRLQKCLNGHECGTEEKLRDGGRDRKK